MPSGSASSGIAMPSGSASSGSAMPFYHHGIYVGGGCVIDFTDESKVRRITLTKFKAKKSVFRVTYASRTPFLANDVVSLDNPDIVKDYSIASNNCEHFATYCKYGIGWSQQVENAPVIIQTLIAAATRAFVDQAAN